jgi:hypothetical protein
MTASHLPPGFPLPSVDAQGRAIAVGAVVRINSVASCARGLPAVDQARLRSYVGRTLEVREIDKSGFIWFNTGAGGANFCLMPNDVSVE